MPQARWISFILFVVLCGIIAGTAPCHAGLPAAEASDEDCCEETTMGLDLCGDTCAGCSERALITSAGALGPSSPDHQDQAPAAIPDLSDPLRVKTIAAPWWSEVGPPLSPFLPPHLASTVLRR